MSYGTGRGRETADWSTSEDPETTRGLDRLWAAILDEGEDFEGLDEDDIEAAMSLQAESS
jgi:hypothetical protein